MATNSSKQAAVKAAHTTQEGATDGDAAQGYKCKSIPVTDWNEQAKAEKWRAAWAELCNQALEQNGHGSRIGHRSYERQEVDQIPTVHLGVAASAMEKPRRAQDMER